MAIEDDLAIEIDDEDINSLNSINELASYCAARITSLP
jgi:acyl carrier protein